MKQMAATARRRASPQKNPRLGPLEPVRGDVDFMSIFDLLIAVRLWLTEAPLVGYISVIFIPEEHHV